MYHTTLKHMNRFGRISLCGCISLYNENPVSSENNTAVPENSLSVLGDGKGEYPLSVLDSFVSKMRK